MGPIELPSGVLLLGAVAGLTYGVLSVGLVLVYRSNRIVNFAHGDIGTFGAAVLAALTVRLGVPYWLGFVAALACGAGVGAASEALVIRRLRGAPSVMSVVATLGLGQLLVILAGIVNTQSMGNLFPMPPGLPEFFVGALFVTRAYSAMIVLTPLLVLSLAMFLTRSRFGLAVRAAASNSDAARMAGVSPNRMSTISWAVAGAVAAFTSVLVLPTLGAVNQQFLGPGLLLRALAASVIARFQSLPIALGAGVGIGVVEQVLLWNTNGQAGLAETLLFAVLLVSLLFQRVQEHRGSEKGSWAAVEPWAPVPPALRELAVVRRAPAVLGAVALAVAIVLPLVTSNASAIVLVSLLASAIVGLSVGIVTGLGGQLSLGQLALAGVGATASIAVVTATGNYILGLAAAAGAAALASLVIGLPALRLKGLLLAVTTLGFALASQNWLLQQDWMLGRGREPGRPVIGSFAFESGHSYYYFTLAIVVVALWVARNIWRSGYGRLLRAVRDNEDAARAFSISATRVKLLSFVVGGCFAGVGGALLAHALTVATPATFPVDGSVRIAAMSAIGGLGVLVGPFLGAAYVIGIPKFVALDGAALAATSLGWLLLILRFPAGFPQLLAPLRKRLLEAVARRAGIELEPAEPPAATPATAGVTLTDWARVEAPDPTRPLLQVTGLSKHFGGVKAVDSVDLAVAQGETVGLIGPNGAGKTTLFELIAGFTRADSGSVVLAGRDVSAAGAHERARQGLIRSFQDAALFPTLTVEDTVKLSLERANPTRFADAVAGRRGAERAKSERAHELIGAMGLGGYRHSKIRELSTGTRRVTELACLLALEPAVLLLDEPAAGVAQREAEKLGEFLLRLKSETGLTLVIIEHDMPLVMAVSDRVVVMEMGRVLVEGTPQYVREHPDVLAAYLGGDVVAIERSDAGAASALEVVTLDAERCSATTRAGGRCTRPATSGGTCRQHALVEAGALR